MKRFRWVGQPTITRSKDGSAGTTLVTGHIYDIADFSAAVVAEWIVTGHAEDVDGDGKDTVLTVKSATVKIKAPKVGVEE